MNAGWVVGNPESSRETLMESCSFTVNFHFVDPCNRKFRYYYTVLIFQDSWALDRTNRPLFAPRIIGMDEHRPTKLKK